jgi:hypothetical protein
MDRLSHHVSEAYVPRISDPELKAQLARAALAHVTGADTMVSKHFDSRPTPREIPPPVVRDQVMHTGWIEN